jgi:DEAD/DEAH box helicase domain-containing protein
MGGLHALEHAAIGVFPLLVLADRNDLGGISTPCHPGLDGAAVFIYDGVPGGAGLCFQAFADGRGLLDATRAAISECPCETGCPSCVHSPKCGSGNRPIDKAGALFLLKALMSDTLVPTPFDLPAAPETRVEASSALGNAEKPLAYGVLDIETQRSAQEVGGWHRADRMRVSCAVLYDSRSDTFFEFVEGQMPMMLAHLQQLDLVVGFNIKRFDYRVLSAYTNMDFGQIPTLDLLEKVTDRLGYRLSLNHLAWATLKRHKTADGLDALRWWKAGKMAKILKYCRSDVAITRDLYRFGRKKRYLLFQNKAKQIVRLPVDW